MKDQLKDYFSQLRITNDVIIIHHEGLTNIFDSEALQNIIVNEFPEFLQKEIRDFLIIIDHDEELLHAFFETVANFYIKFMRMSVEG